MTEQKNYDNYGLYIILNIYVATIILSLSQIKDVRYP